MNQECSQGQVKVMPPDTHEDMCSEEEECVWNSNELAGDKI
jgi:hypothetical protein